MSAEELEVFFADEPEVLAEADCAELLLLGACEVPDGE
jgi:hypothetical protein